MIRIASLFSGIGGFELGIKQAGEKLGIQTTCVFASEIDKYARQIYKKQFGFEPAGDVTKIDPDDIPDFEILTAGFPCQAFSVAGLRRGFQDTRGTLFFEIVRIVEAKRPCLLFLENVRGLLGHEGGKTFRTILESLDDLGYDAEWQVFNSKNHGVPQNRERVFIIGHRRGAGTQPIFPITDCNKAILEKGDGKHVSAGCLSTRNQSGQAQWDGSTTLILTQDRSELRLHKTPEEAPVLKARMGTGGNNVPFVISDGEFPKIRRLTPTEAERLQGFPIGWTEIGIDANDNNVSISDTQRYKCLGNAVTVPVIEFIAERILRMLSEAS